MPKIVVNGVELNYEEHGSGEERVVFIHGARGAATTWRDVLALLPANYHAYALDLRGHGQSAHVTEGCTMSQWANDVYRFSLELGLGKFVYVGVSMGGGVGIQLVIDHPEVLKAAVLVSPVPAHGWAGPADREEMLANWDDREAFGAQYEGILVKGLSQERLQERIDAGMLIKKEAYLSMVDTTQAFNVESRLGEIRVPVMMVIAGKDSTLSPDEEWRTVKQIPGAKAVFFEDEGHIMYMESPQRLVSELTFFIDRLR